MACHFALLDTKRQSNRPSTKSKREVYEVGGGALVVSREIIVRFDSLLFLPVEAEWSRDHEFCLGISQSRDININIINININININGENAWLDILEISRPTDCI